MKRLPNEGFARGRRAASVVRVVDERQTAEEVADRIIEMVEQTSLGGIRGDTAGLVMFGELISAASEDSRGSVSS